MTKPNILLIHCDQLRYDWIGCMGHDTIRTPNIDRLAADGRLYTNHWVTNTICQPSRASLLTGLYPCEHGLWTNGARLPRRSHEPGPLDFYEAEKQDGFEMQPPTMADVFASAGYRTAAFGKMHLQPTLAWGEGFEESMSTWHEGRMDGWTGPFYGFEHVEFTLGHSEGQQVKAGHYGKWIQKQDPALVQEILDKPQKNKFQLYVGSIPQELHHTSWLAQRVAAYVDGLRDDEAFCAFVGFPGPHHPFSPSPDILELFEDWQDIPIHDPEGQFQEDSGAALYHQEPHPPQIVFPGESTETFAKARQHTAAMIYQIDLAVGRIINHLKETGRYDNTIIAFTSDHGDYLGNHGNMLFKHMAACRDLLQVPFILRGPGVEPGSKDDDVMSNADVLRTLGGLAGVEIPAHVRGVNRSKLGSGAGRNAFAFCYNALISGANRKLDNYSLMDGRFRFTTYPRQGMEELFDLQEDPWETRNLASDPARKAQVESFRRSLADECLRASLPTARRYHFF